MVCQHGGADLLSKVCSDVSVEPPLQPLNGEVITPKTANHQDDARANIYAHGFWGQRQGAFLDVRVFHPSYHHSSIPSVYHCHELQKKREYSERVREVELASFTPFVFGTTGGIGEGGISFLSSFG